LSAGILLKPELPRIPIKQKLNTSQHGDKIWVLLLEMLLTSKNPQWLNKSEQARDCKREDCLLHFESPARFWVIWKTVQRSYSSSIVYSSQ